MKTINQDVEVWKQKGYSLKDIYDHVARCARACYQSIPKNKDESSYDFLKRTVLRGKDINDITNEDIPKLHLSVFEHGSVYLVISFKELEYIENAPLVAVINSNYSKYFISSHDNNKYYYVITNMRVIIENGATNLFEQYIGYDFKESFNELERITLAITTDIGCTRELNRHRTHSVSEESSRYCRYSANKFGNNITTIKVPWVKCSEYEDRLYNDFELYNNDEICSQNTEDWKAIDWFIYGLNIANLVYLKCLENNWSAEQAREILPLNTKAQTVHTASINDWKAFIKLRADEVSGKVHPMMKELAIKIKELINDRKS